MSWSATLKRFFSHPDHHFAELTAPGVAAALVPADARYVTVGYAAVLADVRSFNRGEPGSRWSWSLNRIVGRERQVSYLVLTADQLVLIGRSGPRWSCPAHQVTDLDARRDVGFLVFGPGAGGLAVGNQVPVPAFRTVRGMTTRFFGWDEELAPYGTRRHF